ncbi:MAG: UDP-N-acetylmuramoyl-L-alanine--D-glutamate ligase [Acidiphilium sp.]
MKAPLTSWPRVFEGRSFAVLGLGANGLPAAQALATMGAAVVAWDDDAARRETATEAGIALSLPSEIEPLDALVLSPGIPHRLPRPHLEAAAALARGVPILSDAELLFRAVRAAGSAARFVGVTGTNGKSTTTALLAHILESAGVPVAAGGNLGPAALALPLLPDSGIYVLEMSSYMLERIANLRFSAAVMLNLTPDHLDRHGNMAGYRTAKAEIFARQSEDDIAVVGIDDAESRAMADRLAGGPVRVMRISGRARADVFAEGKLLMDAEGTIAGLATAPALPGAHNAQNAAAAAAVALALGIDRAVIAQALASFPGLPHRQKRVAEIAGIAFIDDSKATNAESTARALDCHEKLVWIGGGMAKEGGIESLAPWFERIAEALLIGRDAAAFAETLARHGVPHRIVGTLENAVQEAFAAAQRLGADVVLLSPACASFDQFANYAARGDKFAELARMLGQTTCAPAREMH